MDRGRILAQHDELRRLDPHRRLFAAYAHGYAFADPVDPAPLARVEVALDGPLPDDYRRFLV